MKKLVFTLLTSFSIMIYAQSNQAIDSRLLVNKELGAKAAEYYKSNIAEYQFLVYELDHAFFVQSLDKVPANHKSELKSIENIVSIIDGLKFDPTILSTPGMFNFHAYNFERNQTQTIGYNLGNGNVLVFYSLEKVRENFNQQTTNQK